MTNVIKLLYVVKGKGNHFCSSPKDNTKELLTFAACGVGGLISPKWSSGSFYRQVKILSKTNNAQLCATHNIIVVPSLWPLDLSFSLK